MEKTEKIIEGGGHSYRALVGKRFVYDGDIWHPMGSGTDPVIVTNKGILYQDRSKNKYSLYTNVDRLDMYLGDDSLGNPLYERDIIRYYFAHEPQYTYLKDNISVSDFIYLYLLSEMLDTEVIITKADVSYA